MVTIALDFDETYNINPEMWDDIMIMCQDIYDVKFIMATYRHETLDHDPLFERLKNFGIPCYFTDGKAKRPFLEELGINVNIWIDDNPKSITEDSAWKHDSPELHAWREENRLKLSA